jgi:hypothetical protein
MTKLATEKTIRTADYLFYDLSDTIREGGKFIAVSTEKHRVATYTPLDVPSELTPSLKKGLRVQILEDMWDSQGRIYLIRTSRAKQKDLMRYGVQFDESGPYIERKRKAFIELLTPYLPRMAHKPMVGHAVPATSWGANLHRLLTEEYWGALRKETFAACNNRCEICGTAGELECHELWEYHEPAVTSNPDNIGVQELKQLISLCPNCHQSHHLGFANRQGKLDRALEYVAYINQWDKEQIALYYEYLTAAWTRRSGYSWMLDLSFLPGDDAVTLRKQWVLHKNGFVSAQTKTDEAVTKLLGVVWRTADSSNEYFTRIGVKALRDVPVTEGGDV